ncbi:hypothetical protein RRF57_010217 [Xylaria bambusicola]|uniref:Uncharacterized protein n=1 Tax=Xylaria bambusicola TaxID=326684 RepID=A0AAN7V3F0_9PEZI
MDLGISRENNIPAFPVPGVPDMIQSSSSGAPQTFSLDGSANATCKGQVGDMACGNLSSNLSAVGIVAR